jgi:hypothetical protein
VIGLLILVACGRGGGEIPSSVETPSVGTVSTSAMLKDLPGVRCTASASAVAQPGALLDVSYTLENTSDKPVKVTGFPPSYPMVVHAADGSAWDTADLMSHSWPYPRGESLPPGATRSIDAKDLTPLYVQFPGPFSVTPTCEGQQLDPLQIELGASAITPSPSNAISRAAGPTSGLFDRCVPEADQPAIGLIGPPPGSDLSPFEARCSADVETWNGFSVVTFIIVAPIDVGPITVPPGLITPWELPSPVAHSNGEVVVWRFVVPGEGAAISVGSAARVESARSSGYERLFDVSSSGWHGDGASRCGGSGFDGGSASATVVFLDECRS